MDTRTIELAEGRICRMWHSAELTGEWWDCNMKLHEIAMVLNIVGKPELASVFAWCAEIALAHAVYAVKEAA